MPVFPSAALSTAAQPTPSKQTTEKLSTFGCHNLRVISRILRRWCRYPKKCPRPTAIIRPMVMVAMGMKKSFQGSRQMKDLMGFEPSQLSAAP
jgi:hypothetical protein